jgi:hypothetical protein
MAERFTLRFVLANGLPDVAALSQALEGACTLDRREDGVVSLLQGPVTRARVDLLRSEDARGRTVLAGIARIAETHGRADALDAVRFILEHTSGVVIAVPEAADEISLEASLDLLDRIWDHLFDVHGGLLQIDGEGIFGEEGLMVSVDGADEEGEEE